MLKIIQQLGGLKAGFNNPLNAISHVSDVQKGNVFLLRFFIDDLKYFPCRPIACAHGPSNPTGSPAGRF